MTKRYIIPLFLCVAGAVLLVYSSNELSKPWNHFTGAQIPCETPEQQYCGKDSYKAVDLSTAPLRIALYSSMGMVVVGVVLGLYERYRQSRK